MKKTIMAYTILAVLVLTMAAGCGRMDNPQPQSTPGMTATPVVPVPDVNDGIVNDSDGVITPDDNGDLDLPSMMPETTPDTGTGRTDGMQSPSASPSQDTQTKNR